MGMICQCLLCFARFSDCRPFIFHFSFPPGWFFSSISRTLRFLKQVSTRKGKQSKIHNKLKLNLQFIKRFWLFQKIRCKSNTNMDYHKNNCALHITEGKGTASSEIIKIIPIWLNVAMEMCKLHNRSLDGSSAGNSY